ncbi:MAG: hypothetical protein R2794_04710 [Chitinophagales bacterium]
MKRIKFGLSLIVIAAICVAIIIWGKGINSSCTEQCRETKGVCCDEPPSPINQYVKKIDDSIASIQTMPDNVFCKKLYDEIQADIDLYYKDSKFDRDDTLKNSDIKMELENNLYSAYSQKFIAETKYVFNGTKWEFDDLRFIKSEIVRLKASEFLKKGSQVDSELNEIKLALSKYDEIVSFIVTCNSFNYPDFKSFSEYPIRDVKVMILRAKNLLGDNLENKYVGHCVRLRNELNGIPQVFFDKHVLYLDHKIEYFAGMYINYNSSAEYFAELHRPLSIEIEEMDSTIYKVPNFILESKRLKKKWDDEFSAAYRYFN